MSKWDDIWKEKKKNQIYALMGVTVGGFLFGGSIGAVLKYFTPTGIVSDSIFYVAGTVTSCVGGMITYNVMKNKLDKSLQEEQGKWISYRIDEFIKLCPQYKGKEKELIDLDENSLKISNKPSLSDIMKAIRYSREGVFRGKTMRDLEFLQNDLKNVIVLNSAFKSRPEYLAKTLGVDRDVLCYSYLVPLAMQEEKSVGKLSLEEKIEMYPYFRENNGILLNDGSSLCTIENLKELRRKSELLKNDGIVSVQVPEKCLKYRGDKLILRFRGGDFEINKPMVLTKGNMKSVRFKASNCIAVSFLGNSEMIRLQPSALTLLKLDHCVESAIPKKISPLDIGTEKSLKQSVKQSVGLL